MKIKEHLSMIFTERKKHEFIKRTRNYFTGIFLEFRNICKATTIRDMFLVKNWQAVNKAIDQTTNMKSAGQLHAFHCMKEAGKWLSMILLAKDEDEVSDKIEKFLVLFHRFWSGRRKRAEETLRYNRQEVLRRPKGLPSRDDVATARERICERLSHIRLQRTPACYMECRRYLGALLNFW